MKYLKKIFFGLLLTFTSTAQAALPPLYQDAKEISRILQSGHLNKFNSLDSITSITKKEPSSWVVHAGHTCLEVRVIVGQRPAGTVGPVPFELESGDTYDCFDE